MRDYGKVHSTFWSSGTIGALSDDGRMLALYLMTCPHATIVGVFRLPDGYACEDLKWTSERVCEGFAELFANGFANRCETTKWVWIRKHLDWNPPENPNQRKAVAKIAESIPDECGWKPDFMRKFNGSDDPSSPEKSNPCETLAKPFANQEQEQEQEQKQKQEKEKAPRAGASAVADLFLGISPQVVKDFTALRRAKKAAITPTAIAGIRREADKAGMGLEAALSMCCERGWTGFKADWVGGDHAMKSDVRGMVL